MSKDNKKEVSWRAAEYEYHEKDPVWYLWVVGIAIVLIFISLWQNNFFFLVFIVIAGTMVIFMGKKKPRVVEFKVDNEGIRIDKNIVYEYDDIEWFALRSTPGSLNEIIIKKESALNPIMRMRADSKITPEVIEILKKHVEEKEYDESLIDSVSEMLRF